MSTFELLHKKAVSPSPVAAAPAIINEVLRSPGQPLDEATRAFMEPRFGHDFSRVRVHTDARAAESVRTVNALAYTVGSNMVFDSGQYTPFTMDGRRLIAHELAHVVQQTVAPAGRVESINQPNRPDERQADHAASEVITGNGTLTPTSLTAPLAVIQRQVPTPVVSLPNKVVTVDGVKLRGSTHSRGNSLLQANAIFASAHVRFVLRRADPTNVESDTWLGGDTDLNISTTCAPSAEEQRTFDSAGAAYHLNNRIRAFFVQSLSGANFDAHSFHAGCGSATNEMVEVANNAGMREFAHELGHILLNQNNTAHSADPNNLMADPDPGTQLTPQQCITINRNA